jgi:hypothetical protein
MLIILYGGISDQYSWKHQRHIDGGATCGYRAYAEKYGAIIYMTPQVVHKEWEFTLPDPNNVIEFIKEHPTAIVWSVKHNPRKDKAILSKISNKKVYYSCCNRNMYNKLCDVSLVDTPQRVKGNAKLWFKGKDPKYWQSSVQRKEFDYLLMGRRADKNELYFLSRLDQVFGQRRVLWIGGKAYKKQINTSHEVVCTEFAGPDVVRSLIPKAKVGILFTEHKAEGFPQSFLEMTMCGVPVIYNENAPRNDFYFHEHNHLMSGKTSLIEQAESLLSTANSNKCRLEAIRNYSLSKSYRRIRGLLQCTK